MRILTSHPCIGTESHNPLEDASLPDDGSNGQCLQVGVRWMDWVG